MIDEIPIVVVVIVGWLLYRFGRWVENFHMLVRGYRHAARHRRRR